MYQGKFNSRAKEDPLSQETRVIPQAPDAASEGPEIPPFMQTGSKPAAPQPSGENQKKKRWKPRTGSLIFYTLYILFLLGFAAGLYFADRQLEQWLTDYQAAQPTEKLEQVMNEYFTHPDWAVIYDLAGMEDTLYEGRDAFAAYMEAKVGSQPLTFKETTMGLSGDNKYLLKLGAENIGSFCLIRREDPRTGIPTWELGDVIIHISRNEDITVQIREGQTAWVNGVALDESHIVKTHSLLADRYLPPNVYAHRSYTLTLSGLLVEPEITVTDSSGNALPVTYLAEEDLYRTPPVDVTVEITKDEEKAVQDAVKAYAKFLVGAADPEDLAKHFDTASPLYRAFSSMEPWMEDVKTYRITSCTVAECCRYGDKFFSVRVDLAMNATPKDGDPEIFRISSTFFFELQRSRWLCIGSTNEAILAPTGTIRLTFLLDGNLLTDCFWDPASGAVPVPMVSNRGGQEFAGWYRMDTAADGTVTMTQVLAPGENGLTALPEGFSPEPMTLHGLFTEPTTETEVTE